jgi:SOS-response transcriptional repressor LexA
MQQVEVSLTKIQEKTFRFVKAYIAKNKGESPTFKQISDHLGGNNDTVGHGHMKALQQKGLVDWQPRIANSIRIRRRLLHSMRHKANCMDRCLG